MGVEWREALQAQLDARDQVESVPWEGILREYAAALTAYAQLSRTHDSLAADLLTAERALDAVKASGCGGAEGSDKGGAGGMGSAEAERLRRKVGELQEQVTRLYAEKADKASEMVEALQRVQSQASELETVQAELEQRTAERDTAHTLNSKQAITIAELGSQVHLLMDEAAALRAQIDENNITTLKATIAERDQELEMWKSKVVQLAEMVNTMNEENAGARVRSRSNSLVKGALERSQSVSLSEFAVGRRGSGGVGGGVDIVPTKLMYTLPCHASEVMCAAYNATGSQVASGGADHIIRVHDTVSGVLLHSLSGALQSVMSVQFSHDGNFVLGACNDNAIRLWHLEQGRVRHTFTGHTGKVFAAAYTQDNKRFVSGSSDRTVRVWDIAKGYSVQTIFCPSSCNDVCVSVDNHIIVSAHVDSNVRFWDLRSGKLIEQMDELHRGAQVTSVAASTDGALLLTNARDDTLKVVDLRMQEQLLTLSGGGYRSGANWNKAAFSPDAGYAVAGGADGTAHVWSVQDGKHVAALANKARDGAISCCAWHPHGNQVAVCHKDRRVCLWT